MLLIGAVNKDREGKKTEKAKKQTGIFRDIRILQRQAGSYRTENRPEIRQAGTLDCYSTCQCPALLNGVFVQWNGFPVRVVSFLRINIPLSEPHHGGTVEGQTPPCWLWTCRNSRLKLLFVKGGSGEGVRMMYWQKALELSESCSAVGKTPPSGISCHVRPENIPPPRKNSVIYRKSKTRKCR